MQKDPQGDSLTDPTVGPCLISPLHCHLGETQTILGDCRLGPGWHNSHPMPAIGEPFSRLLSVIVKMHKDLFLFFFAH